MAIPIRALLGALSFIILLCPIDVKQNQSYDDNSSSDVGKHCLEQDCSEQEVADPQKRQTPSKTNNAAQQERSYSEVSRRSTAKNDITGRGVPKVFTTQNEQIKITDEQNQREESWDLVKANDGKWPAPKNDRLLKAARGEAPKV
eukprot:955267-Amphidinium_carterae.1